MVKVIISNLPWLDIEAIEETDEVEEVETIDAVECTTDPELGQSFFLAAETDIGREGNRPNSREFITFTDDPWLATFSTIRAATAAVVLPTSARFDE